jgi:hypothetical protein
MTGDRGSDFVALREANRGQGGIEGRGTDDATSKAWALHAPYSRADQGIGRGTPFSSCLLARQDRTTRTRARELHEAGRLELATTSPPIEQGAHRLREGSRPWPQ